MNNETNIISFEQKKEFILKYLFDNFSTSKEEFLKNHNMLDADFNHQLLQYSVSNSNYFFIKIEFNDNCLSFKQYTTTDIYNNNNIFFVIKGLDEQERNIFKQFKNEDYLERNHFYDNIIIEKNEFISFILKSLDNNTSFQDLFFSGIKNQYLDTLYELLHDKSILDNF